MTEPSPTDLVSPAVSAYADEHTTEVPPHLAEVERSTRQAFGGAAQMMVGRQEGRLLELLVFASGAERVLEIGTFTGYSSLAMAAGLAPGGRITTCEVDPRHAAAARANIASSPYADRIEVVEGPALQTIERLSGPFDLVFVDADKTGYDAYYEAVLPKLAPRGIILADNTLFHGGVLAGAGGAEPNASAEALRAFNDKLVHDPRVVCVLATVRDGLTLVRPAGA